MARHPDELICAQGRDASGAGGRRASPGTGTGPEPPPNPPKPPKPPPQEPFTGWETVTLLAVIVPRLSAVPFAVTHEPTARSVTAPLTVSVTVVEPVRVTDTVCVFGLAFLVVLGACPFTVS